MLRQLQTPQFQDAPFIVEVRMTGLACFVRDAPEEGHWSALFYDAIRAKNPNAVHHPKLIIDDAGGLDSVDPRKLRRSRITLRYDQGTPTGPVTTVHRTHETGCPADDNDAAGIEWILSLGELTGKSKISPRVLGKPHENVAMRLDADHGLLRTYRLVCYDEGSDDHRTVRLLEVKNAENRPPKAAAEVVSLVLPAPTNATALRIEFENLDGGPDPEPRVAMPRAGRIDIALNNSPAPGNRLGHSSHFKKLVGFLQGSTSHRPVPTCTGEPCDFRYEDEDRTCLEIAGSVGVLTPMNRPLCTPGTGER